ncbi:MAG: YraN family protein [Candidatus Nanopelagicales bacterium]
MSNDNAPVHGHSHNRQLGRWGEDLAAGLLRSQGMRVLARNWRCSAGEIDLIALAGRTLVFCEVKTRRSVIAGAPLEAIDERKQQRLEGLAERWLSEFGPFGGEVRFDAVAVTGTPAQPRLEHIVGYSA